MREKKIKNWKLVSIIIILIVFIITIYLKTVNNEKNKIQIVFDKINHNELQEIYLLLLEKDNVELNKKFSNILIQLKELENIFKEEFNKIIYIRLLLIIFIFLFNIILLFNIYQNNKIKKYRENIYKKINDINKFKKEFKQGLKNNEFKIYIQPRYNTNTEKIVGGELLVRWHKDNQIIYPDKFIEKLEEYNLIKKLDLYLLEEICKKLEQWNYKIKISINQSQKNLLNKNYISELKKIIHQYQFNHSLLEIELTENIFIENKEKVKQLEEELHKLNIQIAIDDFGTGYSSYSLLNEIKIDVLKLDKKLFNNLENRKTQIIINAIIKMTRDLKIESVAEGIETKYQLDFLKKINCNEIQGYYFSKPKLIEDFEKELKEIK